VLHAQSASGNIQAVELHQQVWTYDWGTWIES
jgi:hypothetical protein